MISPRFEWTTDGNGFTRDQVEGAIPNGARVVKVDSEPGDAHTLGDCATVIGSVQIPGDDRIAYFVFWDDMPDIPVGVMGWKITPL